MYELGEGYDHGIYGHHVARNTCKVFILVRWKDWILNVTIVTLRIVATHEHTENVRTLCLFFTISGKCGVVGEGNAL